MPEKRLNKQLLGSVPADLRPRIDPDAVVVGHLHLGIGAFHRAHQAVYAEAAMAASGDPSWGICGVTQRSRSVLEALAPQDGLYSVQEKSHDHRALRVVGSVRRVLSAADDAARLTAAFADPAISVVTVTVTEKGYHRAGTQARLGRDEAVLADLSGASPRTVVGQIVRGLAARATADAGPVTIISCDNMPGNGGLLGGLVADFVANLPRGETVALQRWLEENVTFPDAVVDRIVPATTSVDLEEAARQLGLADHGSVVTEPYSQWVVQDRFAGRRPPWELAGATFVPDAAPYEQLKLRLLNACHSALAYVGALAGYRLISECVADDVLRRMASRFMREDAAPTVTTPAGVDLTGYQESIIERFANPALRHLTTQVASDGTQKLPLRLLGTIRDRRAAGQSPALACLAVAAWMRYVWWARSDDGRALPVQDPSAERMATLTAGLDDPARVVAALLGMDDVFGADLRADAVVQDLLTSALTELTRAGARAAAKLYA